MPAFSRRSRRATVSGDLVGVLPAQPCRRLRPRGVGAPERLERRGGASRGPLGPARGRARAARGSSPHHSSAASARVPAPLCARRPVARGSITSAASDGSTRSSAAAPGCARRCGSSVGSSAAAARHCSSASSGLRAAQRPAERDPGLGVARRVAHGGPEPARRALEVALDEERPAEVERQVRRERRAARAPGAAASTLRRRRAIRRSRATARLASTPAVGFGAGELGVEHVRVGGAPEAEQARALEEARLAREGRAGRGAPPAASRASAKRRDVVELPRQRERRVR